jgi:hypothetical protein
MFSNISNWLFNRALRLSHATTVKLAKATGQSVDTISHLNDAGAQIVIGQAEQAANKALSGK